MRFFKIFSVLTLISVVLYTVCFSAEGSVYNDVVRVHVIANSDSETDQKIKLEVRDIVLSCFGEEFSVCTSRESALSTAQSMLSDIENEINTYLSTRTIYTCSVTIEDAYFPTKNYGEFSLPQGNYTALCIRLGKAEGQNFWCVLFPPLCIGASTVDAEEIFINCGLSKDEYELMKGEKVAYRLKFRILELLNPN